MKWWCVVPDRKGLSLAHSWFYQTGYHLKDAGSEQFENTEATALLNKKTFPKGGAQHLRERAIITYMDKGAVGE